MSDLRFQSLATWSHNNFESFTVSTLSHSSENVTWFCWSGKQQPVDIGSRWYEDWIRRAHGLKNGTISDSETLALATSPSERSGSSKKHCRVHNIGDGLFDNHARPNDQTIIFEARWPTSSPFHWWGHAFHAQEYLDKARPIEDYLGDGPQASLPGHQVMLQPGLHPWNFWR